MKKVIMCALLALLVMTTGCMAAVNKDKGADKMANRIAVFDTNMGEFEICLLYTSPSPRDS